MKRAVIIERGPSGLGASVLHLPLPLRPARSSRPFRERIPDSARQ